MTTREYKRPSYGDYLAEARAKQPPPKPRPTSSQIAAGARVRTEVGKMVQGAIDESVRSRSPGFRVFPHLSGAKASAEQARGAVSPLGGLAAKQ
jgi:hypothetical protein